jgi:O-antigen/teichoic acid export membrane protein
MSTLVTDEISAPIRIGQPIKAMLGQKRNRRVAASASVGIFQRVVQVGATFVVMPLLLRTLGPAKFGVWGAAASLAWLSGLVDIGSGTALVTLVARSSAPGRIEQARRHVAGALSIGSGLAALFVLTAFVVSLILRTTLSPVIGAAGTRIGIIQNDAWPYLISAVGLALNLPLNAGNNVWMALQKGYISGWWELIQTLLTTAGLITASMLTQDVRVYVAIVYLGLVLANLGSLAHLFLRHPELRPRGLWFSWPAMREVAGQGMFYFILALAGGLSFLLDNVLALGLLGPEASARMTIALRICVTAAGALWVISQPLWPAFTEAAEKADTKWILKALLRGSVLLVGLTLAGSAVLLAFGERMLRWWLHSDLGIGRGVLWAISAWALSQALVRVPSLLLNGLSLVRYQAVIISIATALALALKFALAPYFGVAGILWATSTVVFLIVIPANVWRIWRWATNSVSRAGEICLREL